LALQCGVTPSGEFTYGVDSFTCKRLYTAAPSRSTTGAVTVAVAGMGQRMRRGGSSSGGQRHIGVNTAEHEHLVALSSQALHFAFAWASPLRTTPPGATCPAAVPTVLAPNSVRVRGCSGGAAWGTPCVLACAAGYNATGSGNYPCGPVAGGAAYTGGSLECTRIVCPAPALKEGVVVVDGCSDGGIAGATCKLACREGYEMAGGVATDSGTVRLGGIARM